MSPKKDQNEDAPVRISRQAAKRPSAERIEPLHKNLMNNKY